VAVIGVGIDLVELTELAATIAKRATTLRRVFTKRELAACARSVNRIEKLAARFAAKEAPALLRLRRLNRYVAIAASVALP
jgi:phosphopantetheine--protein transferase-like protein